MNVPGSARLWLAGLFAACFALAAATCDTKGDSITDTGKTRALRERAEREARVQAEQQAAQASSADAPGTQSTAAAEETTPDDATPAADYGGAPPSASPAVLVDVVRAGSGDPANPENYLPVGDAELALVQVQRGDAGVELQRGMALALGDEIVTGTDVVVLLAYEPNIDIYVMPNTHVRIGSIFVKLGEIWVSIKEALQEKFKVETEFVTAGVEGTQFLLRAGADGAVDVDVVRGAVLCTSKLGRWQAIRMMQRERFTARRDSLPLKRAMLATDLTRIEARVQPVSAAKLKLPPRKLITLDKQIRIAPKRTLPLKPDAGVKQPATQVPPIDSVKPSVTTLPTQPEGSIVKPTQTAPITVKPPVSNVPLKTDIIVRPPTPTSPKPAGTSGTILRSPTKPPSTTIQVKPLPQK